METTLIRRRIMATSSNSNMIQHGNPQKKRRTAPMNSMQAMPLQSMPVTISGGLPMAPTMYAAPQMRPNEIMAMNHQGGYMQAPGLVYQYSPNMQNIQAMQMPGMFPSWAVPQGVQYQPATTSTATPVHSTPSQLENNVAMQSMPNYNPTQQYAPVYTSYYPNKPEDGPAEITQEGQQGRSYKRPRGRPKKYHLWDDELGKYVKSEEAMRAHKRAPKPPVHPLRPKRAMTSFICFANDERQRLKNEDTPEANEFKMLGFGESQKTLSRMWREVDNETKQKYEREAERDKERYLDEVAFFTQINGKPFGSRNKGKKGEGLPTGFSYYCAYRRPAFLSIPPNKRIPTSEMADQLEKEWLALSADDRETYEAKCGTVFSGSPHTTTSHTTTTEVIKAESTTLN
eukprot:m.10905 g.10905  ORF g.10905 m.10905 type:complete len:400 (+) comp4347_c0_seq2:160-1359(+)